MLIRGAEIDGQRRDVRIVGSLIAEIAPVLPLHAGEELIEAAGGALLPGLHDHHCHLMAAAAARLSIPCGPPQVCDTIALAAALTGAAGDGWLRGVGYHESVAGEIDRHWLDRHGPMRPIRIQHRSGRLWVLNGAALDLLGGDAPADGRLLDRDDWLGERIGQQSPDLVSLGRHLAAYGITGVTDATVRNGVSEYRLLAAAGLPQKLVVMGRRELADLPAGGRARVGAVKLHYHDHDLPPLDHLVGEIADAHETGRPVASHCVTRAELIWTLSAIEEAGARPGDRIEHGAIIGEDEARWIARLGLTVVSQPHFLVERGEAYARDVPAADRPWLYRLNGLARHGIPIAAGSDAPFGGLNPWRSITAAVHRPQGFGHDEALYPDAALALWTTDPAEPGGSPRMVATGAIADLCLLDRSWATACNDLASVQVAATIIDGVIAHQRISSISPQDNASGARSRAFDSAR